MRSGRLPGLGTRYRLRVGAVYGEPSRLKVGMIETKLVSLPGFCHLSGLSCVGSFPSSVCPQPPPLLAQPCWDNSLLSSLLRVPLFSNSDGLAAHFGGSGAFFCLVFSGILLCLRDRPLFLFRECGSASAVFASSGTHPHSFLLSEFVFQPGRVTAKPLPPPPLPLQPLTPPPPPP